MKQYEVRTRDQILEGSEGVKPIYPLGRSKNPHDTFISLKLALYIAMRCDKEEANTIRDWLIVDIIPRGFNKIIEEKQQALESSNRQHHLAIEDMDVQHQLAIEEKDATIALLVDENDDLIQNRHVPRRICIDTILTVIEKNKPDEQDHQYYMIRCQKMQLPGRTNVLRVKYPHMTVKEPSCNDGNAVHGWNRFKKDILHRDDYYRNNFNLPEDSRELFEDLFNILI